MNFKRRDRYLAYSEENMVQKKKIYMPNKLEDYRVMDSCAFNHATHSSWLLLLFVNETKDVLNYPNVKTSKTKHVSRRVIVVVMIVAILGKPSGC